MDTTTIYFLIAIIGCVVGIAGWVRSLKREAGASASEVQKLETQISYLLEEISILKSEIKTIQEDIKEILILTIDAKSAASAAHDRLDCLGAITAQQSREEKNKSKSGNS